MNRRGILCLCIGVLLFVLSLRPMQVCAGSVEFGSPYRILVICSYNYAYDTVPDHITGFTKGLGDLNYEITYENMDAKTYFRTADIAQFHDYLSYKLDQVEPYDLVVLMDDTALRFGMNYRDELFAKTPMVFLGVNSISDAKAASEMEDFTGIAEVLDYEANYELLQELFPKRTHYVVFCDSTDTSTGEYNEFLDFAKKHPSLDYSVLNAGYYTKDGLQEALREIGSDSVLIFLDFAMDGDGNTYTKTSGSVFVTYNVGNVPIIRPSASDFTDGILGGYSYSYVDAGKKAGYMARQILLGTDPDELPMIENSVSKLSLEQGALDRFHIKYNQIPEDATIINERTTLFTFYRDHHILSNLLILIFIMLGVIILLLIYANFRRNQMMHQDFLTKVPNRTYLNKKVLNAKENHAPYGIIMVDLDNFKKINDTYGHSVGDELLQQFAGRLKTLTNRDVIFGRIGGDEFMGFMPNPNYEKADRICQSIAQTMSEPFNLTVGEIEITASIGCAMYPLDTCDLMLVSRLADKALYQVKSSGKNDYRLFRDIKMSEAS